ncbi:8899_t:CDS:2, partial [Diversispora eburnea]
DIEKINDTESVENRKDTNDFEESDNIKNGEGFEYLNDIEDKNINLIDVFDAYNDFGTEIPLLNTFNAITWTAEVWDNVTDDIIYRSWARTAKDYINIDSCLETTGIPNVEEEINDAISPVSHKTVLESIENIYNYLQQQRNLNIKHSFIVNLKDLQHQIRLNQISLSKQ